MVLVSEVGDGCRNFLRPRAVEVLAWSGADFIRRTLLKSTHRDKQSANFNQPGSDVTNRSVLDERHCLRTALRSSGYLQVQIDGVRHWALLDTQATGNIMSIEVAKQHNLYVQSAKISFRMLNGSFQLSVGIAWVHCCLEGQKFSAQPRQFHVFESLATPLVLGLPFLREGCRDSEQGVDRIANKRLYPAVALLFENYGGTTMAAVDSGVEPNLMSYRFSKNANLDIHPLNRGCILIGNGCSAPVMGYVEADLNVAVPERVECRLQRCKFLILRTPPYEVGVGRAFISKYGLLQHSYELARWVALHTDDYVFLRGGPFHTKNLLKFILVRNCGKNKLLDEVCKQAEHVKQLQEEYEKAKRAGESSEKVEKLWQNLLAAQYQLREKIKKAEAANTSPQTYQRNEPGNDDDDDDGGGSEGGQKAKLVQHTQANTPRRSQSSSRGSIKR